MDNPEVMYEEAVIAAMFLEPAHAVPIAVSVLSEPDFTHDRYRTLYNAIRDLYDSGIPIDMITLYRHLESRGEIEQVGGAVALGNLSDYVATARNVATHAAFVKDCAVRRHMALKIDTAKAMIDMETEDIDGITSTLEQSIVESRSRRTETIPFKNLVQSTVDALTSSVNGITGVPTGFSALDRKTGGFHNGELVILAARPSIGKTALMLDMTRHISRSHYVGILSLEMSQDQLTQRMIAAQGKVNLQRMRDGSLDSSDWAKITKAMGQLEGNKLLINDSGSPTIDQIGAIAGQWKSQHNIRCLFVDYLQLISCPGENRQQQISEISRRLKMIAKNLNIPVVALSQLNRQVEQRADGKPTLSDLRESGAIEQDADIVMMLYRPGRYKDGVDEKQTQLLIEKHRNGATGEIEMVFTKEYTTFHEAEIWEGSR